MPEAIPAAGAAVTPYLSYILVTDPLAGSDRQRREPVFGTTVAVSGVFPRAKRAE